MALKASLTAVLAAGIVLLVAAPAFAHGVSVVTVEAPSYLPGATVNVSGQFLDGDLAVPAGVVSVTLGTGGSVVGQSQLDTWGNWTLSFTLPAATELGTYVLQATVPAGDAMLISQIALVVGAATAIETPVPVTSPAPEPVPTALGDGAVLPAVVEPAPAPEPAPASPVTRTELRMHPATRRAPPAPSVAARPVRPASAPARRVRPTSPRSQSAARPDLTGPTARPAALTPVRPASAPARGVRPTSPRSQSTARPALTRPAARPGVHPPTSPQATKVFANDGRRAQTRRAPREPASPSSTTQARSNVRAIPSGAAKPAVPTHSDASSRREWILTAALSLLLLLFGGTAASAVWSRRRPFEPLDPVEVELQQMIAEERLRQTLPGAPVRAGTSASAERPLDASEQQYEIVAAGDDDVN